MSPRCMRGGQRWHGLESLLGQPGFCAPPWAWPGVPRGCSLRTWAKQKLCSALCFPFFPISTRHSGECPTAGSFDRFLPPLWVLCTTVFLGPSPVACIEVPSYSGELTLVLLTRLHLRAHAYPETKPLWPLILDRPRTAFIL